MGKLGGTALKLFQTCLYALCFLCAGVILGIYSYFLAVQADRNVTIPTWQKAVEGISGAAVVYTIFAVVLTCCLGGKTFFAFLAVLLDVLFCAGFVALAVLTRDGTQKCTGSDVDSPLGSGDSNSYSLNGNNFGTGKGENFTHAGKIGFACRLNKAAFAVSIIGAFLFLISGLIQIFLGRHHQKEKRFGPSPTNNYTSGSGNRWFKRNRGPKTTHAAYNKDAEMGAVGAGGLAGTAAHHDHHEQHNAALAAHHDDFRPSHETGTTYGADNTYTGNKYEPQPTIPTTGGYHTGPTGTHVNPYGYENNRTSGANF